MGIIYIITVFILFISFILVKKSEKKQNLISIGILSIVLYLAYNIAICLIFGCLNIHTDLVFLSVIIIVAIATFGGFAAFRNMNTTSIKSVLSQKSYSKRNIARNAEIRARNADAIKKGCCF